MAITKSHITIIDYDEARVQERVPESVEECRKFKDATSVTWINVDGLGDIETLAKLGAVFDLHPVLIEDVMNTHHRPKLEDMGAYMLMVLQMVYYDTNNDEEVSEQISIILGPNYVISFQEELGRDVFDRLRERIKNGKGQTRKKGPDYLVYAMIDAIVESYFGVLEKIGDDIENIEDELIARPQPDTVRLIHELKRKMIFMRKSAWPMREVITGLERGTSKLIRNATKIYLRDVYDHTIQVIDTIESYRDMISGMIDVYLSSMSNKMNEVMKVLTVIATIFIPLTFIASIYGMNFRYMPELQKPWGYPFVLGVMAVIGIIMLIFFKKKKWM